MIWKRMWLVFRIMQKSDGLVERLKVRLVVKGYTQTHGIDYEETISPVAKINSWGLKWKLTQDIWD